MTKVKRGDTVEYKGKKYTVIAKLLNYVAVEDANGNQYKVSYSNIQVINETTHHQHGINR